MYFSFDFVSLATVCLSGIASKARDMQGIRMKKKFSHQGFVRRMGRKDDIAWNLNTADEGDSMALRFLYRTAPGRIFLKLLICPPVSKAAGYFLSSRASKGLVPWFIRKHGIDMRGVEVPQGGFASFNDFFSRKRKETAQRKDGVYLLSPCDGWLSFAKIRKNMVLLIKATRFSLEDLLGDERLAERFMDGEALIFRLTPADYHRYCYAADGQIVYEKRIEGKLHCVRPIALRGVPVFARNSREYQVIESKEFGLIVQMEVGALLVGKINNHRRSQKLNNVQRGTEKGYFEFGGSTIILLVQKNAAQFCEKWEKSCGCGIERKVRMGESVAEAAPK